MCNSHSLSLKMAFAYKHYIICPVYVKPSPLYLQNFTHYFYQKRTCKWHWQKNKFHDDRQLSIRERTPCFCHQTSSKPHTITIVINLTIEFFYIMLSILAKNCHLLLGSRMRTNKSNIWIIWTNSSLLELDG